jgi:peroxiredoxin
MSEKLQPGVTLPDFELADENGELRGHDRRPRGPAV